MELLNPTSLPSMAFRQFDAAGQLDCVVALRGTFRHSQDAAAEWVTEQEPFQWEDLYEGDPHQTPLLRQTDLTPGKVGTDVTFLGASHAPRKGDGRWTCGLQIGPVSKQLHVSGPRQWVPQALPPRPWRKGGITGWTLGQPQAVDKVPLDWRLAHGGPPVFRPDAPADNRNPIGCGWLGPADDWKDAPQPAPQILTEPSPDPLHSPMPAGFGPVSPFWQDRARHAGTYDDDWVQSRHPLLPLDFDPRFWQCAPPDQIAIPFLRGDEAYRLSNLWPGLPVATGRLPGLALAVEVNGTGWRPLDLDGVQFDWRDQPLILLTWRTRFPLPEAAGAKLRIGWRQLRAPLPGEAAE